MPLIHHAMIRGEPLAEGVHPRADQRSSLELSFERARMIGTCTPRRRDALASWLDWWNQH
jgi:hypothetical protein